MGVRVGIVSWNTAGLLDRCLDALPEATDGLDVDTVVVDNASSDDSADVAEGHSRVHVIRNPENIGYARGMNLALRADIGGADPAALIALNPDTAPASGSLSFLVERLLSQPDVGLVVPRLVNPDGTVQHSVYRFPSPAVSAAASFVPLRMQRGWIGERFWLEGAARHDHPCDIDWAIGAVHVIRNAALSGSSVYDERWFMYAEDLDLCWRLARLGWRRRLEPDVEVVHVGNASGEQAWGDLRTRRWLEATYDWYRLRHGDLPARAWSAVNAAGVLYRLVQARTASLNGRPLQDWQRQLPCALKFHLEALAGRVDSGS